MEEYMREIKKKSHPKKKPRQHKIETNLDKKIKQIIHRREQIVD